MTAAVKFIVLDDGRLALCRTTDGFSLPAGDKVVLKDDAETFHFDGYVSVKARDAQCSEVEYHPLRECWQLLPPDDYAAAGKGAELLNWSRDERFCGRDGTLLERSGPISKRCPRCGREVFPRLNPAIVVLVTKGEEALLVHASTLRPGIYALVAGFVETGENLEQCVAREVREETALEITDIKYVGSQAWPFPYQLMIGFTARWVSGDVRYADGELTSGRFFRRDEAPSIPTHPSLSRAIIDAWLTGKTLGECQTKS